MGPKVAHIAKIAPNFLNIMITLMRSNMGILIKIYKSCSTVIRRTLRSGKYWLSYLSFSSISRANWKRDPTFMIFHWFWPTLTNQDNVSKNKTTHYVKLDKKRPESSKRNQHIVFL